MPAQEALEVERGGQGKHVAEMACLVTIDPQLVPGVFFPFHVTDATLSSRAIQM